MKTNFFKVTGIVLLAVLFFANNTIHSQTFRKGAFLISASGGDVYAKYNTDNNTLMADDYTTSGPEQSDDYMKGIRDPLILEYGLTHLIGIGISLGGDIWAVDPVKFYGINTLDHKKVDVITKEATLDLYYHMYVSRRIDWTVYGSVGTFSVFFNEEYDNKKQDYYAGGHIFRAGTSLRYYIFKRFAILGMISHYDSQATPTQQHAEKNNLPHNYTTKIKGWAFETGFSFRFGKYAWDKQEVSFDEE